MMMPRARRQLILASTAVLLAIVLIVFLTNLHLTKDQQRPDDLAGAIRWLADHPSDWIAASIVTHRALDSTLPRRFELWREAHSLATQLAPMRPNAAAAYVRAGLFHWYELGADDRKHVLAAAVPLLRDPRVFESMHGPVWELTRDFTLLRRANPGTKHSLTLLRNLAAANGLAAEYRALRDDVRRRALVEFEERRAVAPHGELLMMLPDELHREDEPLLRAMLDELRHRPLESAADMARVTALLEYTLRHDLHPLDGLHPLTRAAELPAPPRARLALRFDNVALASQLELAGWTPGSAEWKQYQLERSRFEAKRGDTIAARLHYDRAATTGVDADVIALAHEIGAPAPPADVRIDAEIAGNRSWSGALFTPAATTLPLRVGIVQTDQTAPYVEVYVDDALVAEGNAPHTFAVPLTAGVHQVEARIVNPRTGGGVERRVKLTV